MLYTKFFVSFLLTSWVVFKTECFVPKKILTYVIDKVDKKLQFSLGYESESLVHEDIMKRGVSRSVARYFYEQPNGNSRIDLSKLDSDYLSIKNVYRDYYKKTFCKLDVLNVLSDELETNVATVDFDSETKDLPSAHFDAEQLIESNERVMSYSSIVNNFLDIKDYKRARKYTGKILHTIHDFYSHSNWVEMGNVDTINTAIGTSNFTKLNISNINESVTCLSNCTIYEVQCNSILNTLVSLIKSVGISSSVINCPIRYFRCKGNIVVTDKLLSGYYVGQEIKKPDNAMKCSHGGIFDGDSFKPAQGGINKDSGYYLFSPHADLHLTAANLAVKHTEYYFELIRKRIGNQEYAKFLSLEVSSSVLNSINDFIQICGTVSNFKAKVSKIFGMFLFWFFSYKRI